MDNRRHDFSTAAEITAALDVQREFGFDAAYFYLWSKGIDADLALGLLNSATDRRSIRLETHGAV